MPELPEVEIARVEEAGSQNPFLVYARRGEGCRRCGAGIESCQRRGRR